MNVNLPKDVSYIIKSLNDRGFEVFIVGGCVRDVLMGKTPKDWDITTSAKPEEVKKVFPKTFDTGIIHGTVTVVVRGENYEVTTYRIDGDYSDGRHPDNVIYTDDLINDLKRRDFTMNAIAYHETTGFKDPFGGIEDIKAKTIKGVGNPSKRFQEDALRMLRAVRFGAQLNFSIEDNTYKAILENADLIKCVSTERIRDEFVKTLLSENPEGLSKIYETGLLEHIDKKADAYFKEYFNKTKSFIRACENNIIFRLSLLFFYDNGQDLQRILKLFKFDNIVLKETPIYVKWLNTNIHPDSYEIRKAVYAIGHERLKNLLYLKKIINNQNNEELSLINQIEKLHNEIIENGDCCSMGDLAVNGNMLIDIGVQKGKQIGSILNLLLDEVLKTPHKNSEPILVDIVKDLVNKGEI